MPILFGLQELCGVSVTDGGWDRMGLYPLDYQILTTTSAPAWLKTHKKSWLETPVHSTLTPTFWYQCKGCAHERAEYIYFYL